jgi:hypothetical protein
MLSSLPNTQLTSNKSQSQALIAPASPIITVYKNVDALANDSIQSYMDDESHQQQSQQENITNEETTDTEANTQC